VRELTGDCNPKEWDGTMMFAGHEWVSRRVDRKICMGDKEVVISGG